MTGASMLAGAQANLGLNGTVQDQSGALVPNARLVLLKDGKTVQQVRSDTAGRVRFSNLRAGRYTLSAQAEGFDGTQQQVSLPYPGESLRIVLKVSSVVTDVIVSADDQQLQVTTDPESNQNAVDLDRDALDRLPVFDADYITTLTRFLNTDASGTNGVSLVVNGMESNGPGVSASGSRAFASTRIRTQRPMRHRAEPGLRLQQRAAPTSSTARQLSVQELALRRARALQRQQATAGAHLL